jgi:hypothetical protein
MRGIAIITVCLVALATLGGAARISAAVVDEVSADSVDLLYDYESSVPTDSMLLIEQTEVVLVLEQLDRR